MRRFDGKVAIVTGGAGGIGAATARRLGDEGARVLIADINADGVHAVGEQLRGDGLDVTGVVVDITDEDAVAGMVRTAVETLGGLDVLHNNAALQTPDVMMRDDAVADLDLALWDRVMHANLRSFVLCTKHAIPALLARGGGVIVNMSSGAGLQGEPTRPAYGSSKAAIAHFTKVVATQYGKQGIRCVAIAPGLVATNALRANMTPEIVEHLLRHFVTPYIAEPEDIASVVAFLASDDARFVTGVTLPVDGGFSVHTPNYADWLGS